MARNKTKYAVIETGETFDTYQEAKEKALIRLGENAELKNIHVKAIYEDGTEGKSYEYKRRRYTLSRRSLRHEKTPGTWQTHLIPGEFRTYEEAEAAGINAMRETGAKCVFVQLWSEKTFITEYAIKKSDYERKARIIQEAKETYASEEEAEMMAEIAAELDEIDRINRAERRKQKLREYYGTAKKNAGGSGGDR